MNWKCCVVIPVYKDILNPVEKSVLENIFQKLDGYSFCFIAPQNLDLAYYRENWATSRYILFQEWSSDSLSDYNNLMMQSSFYRCFEEYEYIFIFQLDGLLLMGKKELEPFIQMGYDYIGAPWPDGGYRYCKRIIPGSGHFSFLRKLQGETICQVGNGGVSLRKVRSMINFFDKWASEVREWNKAEDIFISFYAQKRKFKLNIAPVEVASKFSLEGNMKEEIQKGNIPLAVHKWEYYYPELVEKVGLKI